MGTNDNRNTPAGSFDTVLAEIAAERERQIAKGYTAAADDALAEGALTSRASRRLDDALECGPKDFARQTLIEAAALIVAEIQRLDRQALRHG